MIQPGKGESCDRIRPDRPVALVWGLFLSAVFFLILLAVLCGLYLRSERDEAIRHWNDRLSSTADDRRVTIEAWLNERWADIRTVAQYPDNLAVLEGPPASREEAVRLLTEHLTHVKSNYEYEGVYLLGPRFEKEAVAPGSVPLPAGLAASASHPEGDQGERVLLCKDAATARRRIGFLASIRERPEIAPGRPIGWIFISVDPSKWLFPLLGREAEPSLSSELLLVAAEKGNILFVNPTRFKVEAPSVFRRSMSSPTLAARFALQGTTTFGAFTDYRGVPIFAATRPIRGSRWGLVAKVDQEEALAVYREKRVLALTASAALLLAFLGFSYSLWRRQQTQHLREMLRRDERYRLLSERARDIILFVRPDGTILEAGKAAEEVYGYSRKELINLSVRDLRAPDRRDDLAADLKRVSAGDGALFETAHVRRDGTVFPVEVSSIAAEVAGERVLLSVIRDITERKEAETRILHLNRLLRTISEVNQMIVRTRDEKAVLEEACRILVEFGGFRRSWIGLPDEAGEVLAPAASAFHPDFPGDVPPVFLMPPDGMASPAREAFEKGEPALWPDLEAAAPSSPWAAKALAMGLRSSSAFPIRCQGKVAAILSVCSDQARPIAEDEKAIMEEMAGDVGFAIESIQGFEARARAEEALRESEDRIQQLVNSAAEGIFGLDPQGLCTFANKACARILGAAHAEDLVGKNMHDLMHHSRESGSPYPVEECRMNLALNSGEAVHEDEEVFWRADGSSFFSEYWSYPQIRDGAVAGAVVSFFDITERKRAEALILRLNSLLRTISEVNQLVVRERDRDALFSGACRILVEEGEFVMAWVGLKRPDGTVECVAKSGDSTGYLEGITVRWDDTPEGRGPTGTSVRENRHAVNVDVRANPAMAPWREAALEAGYLSSGSFPVQVGNEAVGALTVYMAEANALGAEEVDLLDELAGDLGFALEAILERQNREEAERSLRESEARFALFMENFPARAFIKDAESRYIYMNGYFAKSIGRRHEDALGKSPEELFDAETAASIRDHDLKAFSRQAPTRWREKLHLDGAIRIFDSIKFPLSSPQGMLLGGISIDITERERTVAALKQSETKFRALFESLSEGMALHELITDHEGNPSDYVILDVNPAFESLLKLDRTGVLGKRASEVYGTGEAPCLDVYSKVAATGRPSRFQSYFEPMGKHFEITAFSQDEGKFATLFTDISERQKAEARLREYVGELERWYKAMIGRETRNLELKREVNALLRTEGRPPRYPSAEPGHEGEE